RRPARRLILVTAQPDRYKPAVRGLRHPWRHAGGHTTSENSKGSTMATVNELKATARPRAGKGAARAVRREGRVPGVIYGDNQPPIAISLDFDELKFRIHAGRFLTTISNIEIDGKKHKTIPRDFQVDPVRDNPIHVDFLRLGEGATIRVRVPIHVMNIDQSPGVKRGGAVNIVTHHLEGMFPPDCPPLPINHDT